MSEDGRQAGLELDDEEHGLKLVVKGKRNGLELTWQSLVSGEAALAAGLNASLAPKT